MTSVRRLLQAFLALGVTAIALVGLLGTIATLSSSRTVNHMVDDLAPASLAGVAVRADMLQAGAAVRGFAMSGDQAQVAAYRAAVNRCPTPPSRCCATCSQLSRSRAAGRR